MIPKPLSEIGWADIEALRDSGREEDDTIEFKSSFSGGSDYLEFNDSKRAKAIEGIAREAVAFLNGRGGDIIIGVCEAANDHPKIEKITPVQNVVQTSDRLEQSLAALIEPTQAVLALRAIRLAEDASEGVIIVRCPPSLRAPHRFTPTKECYVRRGRSSVPMPMDEVQDLSVRRFDLRSERLDALERQFSDLDSDRIGRSYLNRHRIHFRTVLLPFSVQQIEIDDQILGALNGHDPLISNGTKGERIDVPFRHLSGPWKPVLRGRRLEKLQIGNLNENDFFYSAKQIGENGNFVQEFACRVSIGSNEDSRSGFFFDWIAGYGANVLNSCFNLAKQHSSLIDGVMRTAIFCDGPMVATFGGASWDRRYFEWPRGTIILPDSPLPDPAASNDWLTQFQIDAAGICGFTLQHPYKFVAA